MNSAILFFLLTFSFAACSRSPQAENREKSNEIDKPIIEKKERITKIDTETTPLKKTENPNDEFRESVLIAITNQGDINIFNTILVKLDKQNLSVCNIIRQLFAIDDECLANARSIYPDPSQQELFSTTYSSFIKEEYGKYSKSINLTMDEIRFFKCGLWI